MDCSTVTQEATQLQSEIRRLERALQICEQDPQADCTPIENELNDDRMALDALEPKLGICGLLIGAWAFNGNGFTGTLTIDASDVQDDGTASLSGHAVIDVPHTDTLSGSYDNNTGVLRFTRTGDDNNARFQPQQYYGHLFANPSGNANATFAGVFAEGAPPSLNGSLPWGWFMIRQ